MKKGEFRAKKIRTIKGKSLAALIVEKALPPRRKFDPLFVRSMYVDYMSDPENLTSKSARKRFALNYHLTPKEMDELQKDVVLQREIRTVVRERFGGGERIKELYELLWDQCREGRISAIRLALELTGEYVPKMQHLERPKSLEDMLDKMDKKEEDFEKDYNKTLN